VPVSEARIGRVLVASLHQAIADELPMRLEFYENWLNASGLREGTIGLAPLSAVLSFLRGEGDAYNQITAKAGRYAADWTVSTMPPLRRRMLQMLPAPLRVRMALRTAGGLVRATYPGSRAIVRLKRGTASVELRGSLFCEVREASVLPLCGFYAAAIARVLEQFALRADARVDECRAAGGRKGCLLVVVVHSGAGAGRPEAA
jgi:bacteriochlorophyll 4-vinyl reductase